MVFVVLSCCGVLSRVLWWVLVVSSVVVSGVLSCRVVFRWCALWSWCVLCGCCVFCCGVLSLWWRGGEFGRGRQSVIPVRVP